MGGAGPALKATIDIRADLQAELRRLHAGDVWVVTYSIHQDVFEGLFAPFKESFTFHILVDCGGICPSGITGYGRELSQIFDATLHAKLILIEPRKSSARPLAYFLTGNIRQSLVDHENECVKIELSSNVTAALKSWLKKVRNAGRFGKPFLLSFDANTGRQEQINCKSIGSGILMALKRAKVVVKNMVLLAPWGCTFTVRRLCEELPSARRLDIYAGCNEERGDVQKSTWVAGVPSPENCTISRFAQSRRTRDFIHTKAAMFEGFNESRHITFVYAGSGNLTKRGFWEPDRGNECPNIECGVLLIGTGNGAARIAGWFSRKIIGNASRWKRLPEPKSAHLTHGGDVDITEEFIEDEAVCGLQKNGFERRRLTKILNRALNSRNCLGLLRQLCSNAPRTRQIKKRLESMLCSYCSRNGERIAEVGIGKPEILERYPNQTRVGLMVDTDNLRDIYIVVDVPGRLPHSEEEIEILIEDLIDFDTGRSSSDGNHLEHGQRIEGIEDMRTNFRFPYRNLFILRDNLRRSAYGEEEFVRRIKRKVAILNELDGSRVASDVPLWWKSILLKILKEEQ
jgi:hypothetical protein